MRSSVRRNLTERELDRSSALAAGFNRATIASYEGCAADYTQSTAVSADPCGRQALEELIRVVPAEAWILEVGSGPGWDADWLEERGRRVRRTDAVEAFIALQRSRGKLAEPLDIIHDELGGPYSAVLAMYVFQHIERALLPTVLAKIVLALKPQGVLLFTLLEGEGDAVEAGSDGGRYYVAKWQQAQWEALLATAGLHQLWSERCTDSEGHWISLLVRRR